MAAGEESEYAGWFAVHSYPPRLLVDYDRLEPENEKWLAAWQSNLGLEVEESDRPGPPIQPSYEAWFGVPTMPRVDLSHPPARDYMLDVLTSWVDRFDIDAWRMDVARYVDPDVWPEARSALTEHKPDFFLLAEVMGDASEWLQGNGFHAAMNYTFRAAVLDFLAYESTDAEGFLEAYLRLLGQYAWGVTLASHNLIGSHDTPRFLTEATGQEWRLRLALVMQMTLAGSPGIYYGDEVGLDGGEDPECRKAFPWDRPPLDHPLAATVAELTRLRRAHPALIRGEWRAGEAKGGLLTYRRMLDGEELTVVINRGGSPASIVGQSSPVWGEATPIAGGIAVGARSAAILAETP